MDNDSRIAIAELCDVVGKLIAWDETLGLQNQKPLLDQVQKALDCVGGEIKKEIK